MKKIIIFLLVIIVLLIGYGKYSQYKRYSSPEINYKTDKNIDISYHNQEILMNYYEAVEALDSYVMLQWSANEIDVRTPEDDDIETKVAVENYAKKLAKVHYYEAILENSTNLKEKGLDNKEIKFLETEGVDLKTYKRKLKYDKIKNLFNSNVKLYNGEKNAIIYEVQKELNRKGDTITVDGVYRIETFNAIKAFEEKNNLLADGYLDDLTLEIMFE
ncbi:peptidoglycan-binding domain-containing protein [Polaribacter vadi]|uniref:peptidoglycan-binding domain-containing protein n=1 Tax=Polaribacter vadi TaxID=1774273 RepID=UPI0030EB4C17|tara:strand:- start:13727 stop:14377 length:651 start_codon:yes stop_codon:yes gene_type:complete